MENKDYLGLHVHDAFNAGGVITDVHLSATLLGCLDCVICDSKKFSFLYIQTLFNDCSHIEDMNMICFVFDQAGIQLLQWILK